MPDPMNEDHPMTDVDLDWYAQRILHAQSVQIGPIRWGDAAPTPVHPLLVGAVLHALADHTMLVRLLRELVDEQRLCPPGDQHADFAPRETSLGRFFHRVGDLIDLTHFDDPRPGGTPIPVAELRRLDLPTGTLVGVTWDERRMSVLRRDGDSWVDDSGAVSDVLESVRVARLLWVPTQG